MNVQTLFKRVNKTHTHLYRCEAARQNLHISKGVAHCCILCKNDKFVWYRVRCHSDKPDKDLWKFYSSSSFPYFKFKFKFPDDLFI